MSDSLVVFGETYTGVTGIKAKNTSDTTLAFIRPQGNKAITENGTNIDVAQYATVSVDVSGGGSVIVTTTQDSHGGDIVNIETESSINLRNDTVSIENLLYGYTAHNRSGQAITGAYLPSGGPVITRDSNDYLVLGATSTGGQAVYTSSTGILYTPIMTIDLSMERTNGYTVTEILSRYGNMPYLEELTLTGIARRATSAQLISNYPILGTDRYPLLKKLHLQPTEMRDGSGNVIGTSDANYNAFDFGHYIFNGTNLTELTLGRVGGPFCKGGGYFRNDMLCPPGTASTDVGSIDGLTVKIYTDTYRSNAGFSASASPYTTIIEYDYTTGEVLTP